MLLRRNVPPGTAMFVQQFSVLVPPHVAASPLQLGGTRHWPFWQVVVLLHAAPEIQVLPVHCWGTPALQRLVPFTEDEMLKRVRRSATPFRSETMALVADPLIFSDVCEVVCDAVYDMLYNDGFLDLPNDWRAHLQAAG